MKKMLLLAFILGVQSLTFAEWQGSKFKPTQAIKKQEVQLNKIKSADSKTLINNIEKLKDGEKLLIEDGEYNNLGTIEIKGKGKIITAKNPGKVIFSGLTQIIVDGNKNELSGIVFTKGGPAEKNGAIVVRGNENKIRNNSIIKFNDGYTYAPNEKGEYPAYRWITIQGKKHEILNNRFEGKNKRGTLLVVDIDETPEDHVIAQNIFKNFQSLVNGEKSTPAMERTNSNSWEVMRIGDSKTSLLPSETEILYNLFDDVNGETEMLSIKSCKDLIKGNTVLESQAMISLRHGNDSIVEDNVILGKGKPMTGGIRMYGENHIIRNNYIEDVRGTGDTRAGIAINTGVNDVKNNEKLDNSVKGKELNKQWTPKNISIENNTIVNSAQNILYSNKVHKVSLTDDSKVEIIYSAVNTKFRNNLSTSEKEEDFALVTAGDGKNPVSSIYLNEHYIGKLKNIDKLPNGISDKLIKLIRKNGLLEAEDKTIGAKNLLVLTEELVGPSYKILEK